MCMTNKDNWGTSVPATMGELLVSELLLLLSNPISHLVGYSLMRCYALRNSIIASISYWL